MRITRRVCAAIREKIMPARLRRVAPIAQNGPFGLLSSFAVLSFLLIGTVGIIAVFVILSYKQQEIVEHDASTTAELVRYLASAELRFPRPDDVAQDHSMAELFAHVANIPDVFRANIYSPDARVIWSTEERLIGRNFSDNHDLMAALGGRVVFNHVTGGGDAKPEHTWMPLDVKEFVETYVPVRNPIDREVIGVVEVYRVPRAMSRDFSQGGFAILVAGILGAALSYVALFWMVRRAETVMRTQYRQLLDQIDEHMRDKEDLKRAQDMSRMLSGKLLGAQEKERKRIASELHDGLGQSLSAIKFNLENGLRQIKPCAEQCGLGALDVTVTKLRDVVEEVRRISMAMRPSILDDLGILATIDWFCREFQRYCPKIEVSKQVTAGEADVPDRLKGVIYRIMQEAFNNVAKHSGAERVDLVLARENNHLRLSIRDYGRGFDPAGRNGTFEEYEGVGLDSMSERAQVSGGEFGIVSRPGEGTTVEVVWPLAAGAAQRTSRVSA